MAMSRGTRIPSNVLALDVGTSSVRALLFDQHARQVPGAVAQIPYQPRVTSDGGAEVDSTRLVDLVTRVIRQLLTTVRRSSPPRRIVAVGSSTFWHSLVAADDSGRALTPVYLWADSRSWREAEELRERVDAAAVRHRTGCLIHPSYWPAKLAWLRKQRPELWSRPVRWLSFGDLLYWQLFGRPLTSLSMASGTGLFRLDNLGWDAELLDVLQVRAETLPELGEAADGLLPGHGQRFPELAGVPWLTPLGDGALANFGSACTVVGRRALSVGTSGALRVLYRGAPPERIPDGLWCYRLDGERPVVGGSLSNAGNIYAWLTKTLSVDTEGLERQLSLLKPAAHGLTFLPLLAGERSVGFALHATGAIAGLTLATTPVDLVRAGLEAIAIEFARVDRRLDQVLPGAELLVASGGGLASPTWTQIMADAIGKPVAASKDREASARGAAIRALEQRGLLQGDQLQPHVGRTFAPDPPATETYARQLARQENLYRLLIAEQGLEARPLPELLAEQASAHLT
jgi:gluconokinase